MKSASTVYPKSKNFLNLDDIEEFSRHTDTDLSASKNEFTGINPCVNRKRLIM